MTDINHLIEELGTWADPRSIVRMVVLGAIVFGFTFVVTVLIRRGVRHVERHLTDVTTLGFVSAFAQLLTYLLGLMVYAHLIPQLQAIATALLAGVSIISVVVGVAAQGTLGNLVAGFSLVISRTVRVGDVIRLAVPGGPLSAKVQMISLGYTMLLDDDNHEVIVPNSVIMGSAVTRVSRVEQAHGDGEPARPQ